MFTPLFMISGIWNLIYGGVYCANIFKNPENKKIIKLLFSYFQTDQIYSSISSVRKWGHSNLSIFFLFSGFLKMLVECIVYNAWSSFNQGCLYKLFGKFFLLQGLMLCTKYWSITISRLFYFGGCVSQQF